MNRQVNFFLEVTLPIDLCTVIPIQHEVFANKLIEARLSEYLP